MSRDGQGVSRGPFGLNIPVTAIVVDALAAQPLERLEKPVHVVGRDRLPGVADRYGFGDAPGL
jgi:hypothetical protein